MKVETTKTNDISGIADRDADDIPEFPPDFLNSENLLEIFHGDEVKATHPAEPDLFARHDGIPAHNQKLLEMPGSC